MSALIITGCTKFSKVQYVRQSYSPINPEMVLLVYVDKAFGEADRINIQEAVDQWNYTLNNYLVLKVAGFDLDEVQVRGKIINGGVGIIKIKHADLEGFGDPKLLDHLGEIDGKKVWIRTLGFTDKVGGRTIYLVRDMLGNGDVKPITLHEIGHMLGADHHSGGLMTPLYDGGWECVDRETMEAVARYWKLPAWRLNWCYKGDDPLN